MANPAATPRFLLPQLTWTPLVPRTFASTPHINSFPLTCGPSSNPPRRTLGSIAKPWHHHARRTLSIACLSNLPKSPSRPSPAATTQPRQGPSRILSRIPFSTTSRLSRDHHFDTLKLIQRLKDDGFSEEQSKAMMLVLSDVIEESIQNLTRTMVLREDADRSTYTQKVDFTKLRSELLALDASDTSVTLASHERLSNDIAKLNSRLRDEIGRAQASVRLDLNLEKGRIREEAKKQELKIKETETRIEQEVAGLRERVEGVKFNTLQWLVGVCSGAAALTLGAWRILM
ncbi:MAG: hypothetical protein Q9168_000296 [Polycauliona sp. 1 TL-2023]